MGSETLFNFKGQTALITGASSGIGREIACQFAAAGARVIVHYRRDAEGAAKTLGMLEGSGHITAQADLADASTVEGMVQGALDQVGAIDILVNNAGIYIDHAITEVDFEGWEKAWTQSIAVNLMGPARISYAVAQHMITRGKGRIVNVSSRSASRSEPGAPAYAASKAGLNAMAASLAKALGPHGISVITVAPGFVATGMAAEALSGPGGEAIRNQSPMGRVADPTEVARTILFMASQDSQFLTGGTIDINGASYCRP